MEKGQVSGDEVERKQIVDQIKKIFFSGEHLDFEPCKQINDIIKDKSTDELRDVMLKYLAEKTMEEARKQFDEQNSDNIASTKSVLSAIGRAFDWMFSVNGIEEILINERVIKDVNSQIQWIYDMIPRYLFIGKSLYEAYLERRIQYANNSSSSNKTPVSSTS